MLLPPGQELESLKAYIRKLDKQIRLQKRGVAYKFETYYSLRNELLGKVGKPDLKLVPSGISILNSAEDLIAITTRAIETKTLQITIYGSGYEPDPQLRTTKIQITEHIENTLKEILELCTGLTQ